MSARAAVIVPALPRPWLPPTLTEHGPLTAMVRVSNGAVPMVAALLQIGVSCQINPQACG